MPTVQDNLIPAVDACDLVEQNYPVIEEVCTAPVLDKKLIEKISSLARAEANVPWRREQDPLAEAFA